MSAISGAQLRALIDSIAAQKIILDTAVGATGTAATILYGMQANVTRIAGYGEDAINDLALICANEKAQMPNFKNKLDHDFIKALESHLRRLEDVGISDYWEAEQYPTYRIPSQFAEIARSISLYLKASLCFPPVTAMGTFAVTGVGAGTFTDGSAIDGNLYGPGDCEVKITAAAGGPGTVSFVATVTGTDENGAVMTGTATVVSKSVDDVVAVVPTEADKKFQDITNITITGGANGDAFKIQSKVDRSVSL